MRRQRDRGDAGETLIEMVLSVLFVSLAVVMIVAAVGTGVSMTTSHKSLTDTDVALKRAAEHVKGLAFATTATYSVSSLAFPAGVSVAVTSVKCLPASAGSQNLTAATTCTATDTLQVVALSATASGTSEQTVVMKRKLP